MFRSVYRSWPNLTLHLDDEEYFWTPLNYYYYSYNNLEYKACLGFDGHKAQEIILGANFFHGHDIIFDRKNKRLGVVPSEVIVQGNLEYGREDLVIIVLNFYLILAWSI